jgi:hypothetical protein
VYINVEISRHVTYRILVLNAIQDETEKKIRRPPAQYSTLPLKVIEGTMSINFNQQRTSVNCPQ